MERGSQRNEASSVDPVIIWLALPVMNLGPIVKVRKRNLGKERKALNQLYREIRDCFVSVLSRKRFGLTLVVEPIVGNHGHLHNTSIVDTRGKEFKIYFCKRCPNSVSVLVRNDEFRVFFHHRFFLDNTDSVKTVAITLANKIKNNFMYEVLTL
jgi:hypothetical protein